MIQFEKPGTYTVEATYSTEFLNYPESLKGGMEDCKMIKQTTLLLSLLLGSCLVSRADELANLQAQRVETLQQAVRLIEPCREVHDHATQSTKTRPLSHSQVLTSRALMKRLIAPDAKPALENLLIVSLMLGEERRLLAFDATKPPPAVMRLYDLTGAYLPAAADDDQRQE